MCPLRNSNSPPGNRDPTAMLEQWVIDRLDPLKGEALVMLADPQRMIRAGARAVDGWAKENGFTVLFCSGNLALRERYENLRDDPKEEGDSHQIWRIRSGQHREYK